MDFEFGGHIREEVEIATELSGALAAAAATWLFVFIKLSAANCPAPARPSGFRHRCCPIFPCACLSSAHPFPLAPSAPP